MSSYEKVGVILADEMKLKRHYKNNEKNNTLLYPRKFIQVIQTYGLFKNWKQPIFYQYDYKLKRDVIFSIITPLENTGYNIVAIIYMT